MAGNGLLKGLLTGLADGLKEFADLFMDNPVNRLKVEPVKGQRDEHGNTFIYAIATQNDFKYYYNDNNNKFYSCIL